MMSFSRLILILVLIFFTNFLLAQNYKKPSFFALATIDSIFDGDIDTSCLFSKKKILILSDKKLKVQSFTMQLEYKDDKCTSSNDYFTKEMIDLIHKSERFHKAIVLDNIIATFKKDTFLLNPIVVKIADKKSNIPNYSLINYASIAGKYNATIEKNCLMAQVGIDSLPSQKIIGFSTIPLFDMCFRTEERDNKNRRFSGKTSHLMSIMTSDRKIAFRNIRSVVNNSDTVVLTPIVLRVK